MTPAGLRELLDNPAVPVVEIQSRLAAMGEQERGVLAAALLGKGSGLGEAGRMRLESVLRGLQRTSVRRREEDGVRGGGEPTQLRAPAVGYSERTSAPTELRS